MSSLQERFARVREERSRSDEYTFELPVPGYEQIGLWARYRVLDYKELRQIGNDVALEKIKNDSEEELAEYATTIIRACVELLEKTGDDSFQSLGYGWSADGIRKLGADLPEGATARQAVFAVFNGPMGGNHLFHHFREFSTRADEVGPALTEDVQGESEPSEEGSSKSPREQQPLECQ